MRVFMTGGTGYVGAHIAKALVAAGDKVTVLTRNKPRGDLAEVSFIEGDVTRPELYEGLLRGHDALVHVAIVWKDRDDEDGADDLRASIQLFQAAAQAGIEHVVYTSSTAVHRPFQRLMDEDAALFPTDFYAATKAAAETYLYAVAASTFRGNVVRAGPVIGQPAFAWIRPNCDRRFLQFIEQARNGETIQVRRDEGRQFIEASDLAKLFAAVLHGDSNRKVYLAVAQDLVTWEEIAEEAVKAVGSGAVKVIGEREEPRAFDVQKIRDDFGLSFQCLPEIRPFIEWLVANGKTDSRA